MEQRKPVEQVLMKYMDRWLVLPEVVGMGQGVCVGQPCLKVYVTQVMPQGRARIPAWVEGYPVVVEVTGDSKAAVCSPTS